jgi:hypothetical protein
MGGGNHLFSFEIFSSFSGFIETFLPQGRID